MWRISSKSGPQRTQNRGRSTQETCTEGPQTLTADLRPYCQYGCNEGETAAGSCAADENLGVNTWRAALCEVTGLEDLAAEVSAGPCESLALHLDQSILHMD